MTNTALAKIKEKISARHRGDAKQLQVIFSDSPRLIVEAPAGYGKTKTMISRIAYLFASGGIPNPKRILGLTFSVNAALKVKREVAEKLPDLLGSQNSPVALDEKITFTNYHGFCKGVLKKYGYLIADALRKDINLFRAVGESDLKKHTNLQEALDVDELKKLNDMETTIKELQTPDAQTINAYNEIVIKKLLPLGYITHNAVILFVLKIFNQFPEVKKFYQSYYPLIVVDEFQDTNCIAWELLETIIAERTKLFFLGDPLQRIYGFIGALPDIMTIVAKKYGMTKVSLSTNYRFHDNPEMLKLDKNIRENAASCFSTTIPTDKIAKLPCFLGENQQDEVRQIVSKIQTLMGGGTDKIAILFRARGTNAEILEKELTDKSVSYFYGMFTDEDDEYVEFHNKCQEMFRKQFEKSKNINKKTLMSFSGSVKKAYDGVTSKPIDSLFRLLDALVEKVSTEYSAFLSEDKYNLLLDIFENRQLKQAMEYVNSRIILSTVHGAKGLEWDYVVLAGMERWVFPVYYVCSNCPNKLSPAFNRCCSLPIPLSSDFRDIALDELSVFYVGITRARKQAFVSASSKRIDSRGKERCSLISCLVAINGITLVQADMGTTI